MRAKKSRFLKKENLTFEGQVEEPVEKRRKIIDAELGDSSRLSGSNLSDNEYTSSVTAHYDVPMKIENTDSNASGQFPESSTMEGNESLIKISCFCNSGYARLFYRNGIFEKLQNTKLDYSCIKW